MVKASAPEVHRRSRACLGVSPARSMEPSMATASPIAIASHARGDGSEAFTALPAT